MFNTRHITIIQAKTFIISCFLALTSPQPQQGSIHLSLIHRDSTLSPLHNPQTSPYERIKHSFVRSKARLPYLINMTDQEPDMQGKNEEENGKYFVKFTIGTPPVQMLASMDIASELILTRMNKLAVSLSCSNITCNSSECTLLPRNACDNSSNICSISYGNTDFSRANSLLRRDVFNFETSNGEHFPLEDVAFGSKYDIGSTSYKYDGVLGLGYHNLSLIMQTSSITEPKFTYCFGNSSDPEAENRLVLGNAIFLEGKTTTLKVINGRYNLVLKGLSIGSRTLQISPDVFQSSPTGGGVIIDTGTPLTFIAPDAYERIVEEMEEELHLELVFWPDPPYQQCYKGKLSDIPKFQGLVFRFEREVNVVLDVTNLFLQVEDSMFCLALLPSPVGVSVLGSLFQQSYSVGYHLDEMLVSFEQIKCDVLEKHTP